MQRLTLYFIFPLFLMSSLGWAKDPRVYESAQLLSISHKTVNKSRFTGESFGDVTFMTNAPYKAIVYDMVIEMNHEQIPLVYELKSRKDPHPPFQVGDLLEVRRKPDDDEVFIKRPDGKEMKTKIQQ